MVNADASPGAEALNGLSTTAELDGKDPAEQVQIRSSGPLCLL